MIGRLLPIIIVAAIGLSPACTKKLFAQAASPRKIPETVIVTAHLLTSENAMTAIFGNYDRQNYRSVWTPDESFRPAFLDRVNASKSELTARIAATDVSRYSIATLTERMVRFISNHEIRNL